MDYPNAWNNFQKEQKRKLKRSTVADNQKLKDIWNAMPKEEKEKYGLKHDQGPRISIQCSDTEFVNSWKKLEEERCTSLKNNLKDNPFKSFLELDGGVRRIDFILDLVSIFNISKKSLHIDGHDYIITPEDFTDIMGIKDGEEEINLKKDPSEELKNLFVDRNARQFVVSNKKVLEHLKSVDVNIATRAYALSSLIHIVCAPGRGSLNGMYLHNIDDMKNKKWATHAIDTLVQGITSFKKGKGLKQKRLGGCVLFLQLFYMSKAGMTPSKDVRLLKYVKKNVVDEFLKQHKKSHHLDSRKRPSSFNERKDAELNESGVGEGEKKPKRQKVTDEEVDSRKRPSSFNERKDEELNGSGVGEGEKKPKRQKVTDEEGVANSLNLKYQKFVSSKQELEEQLDFCGKVYPLNETYKEIKNKMQISWDGVKSSMKESEEDIIKSAKALMMLKNQATPNEDTICIGPFRVRTTNAPNTEDRRLLEWIFKEQHVEEEEAEVASLVGCCFPLKKKEMYHLYPNSCLSNFIINFVVEMLCVKELKKRSVERWYFMENFLVKDEGSLKNCLLYLKDIKKLKGVKQLFFPIRKNKHFFLIVVNTQEKVVEVWDTLKKQITCYEEEFKNVFTFLDKYIHPQQSSLYTKNVVDIHQQENSYDCGVFLCYYLEFPENVHKFLKEKWFSDEERCELSLRILNFIDNKKKEHIYECAERWFKEKESAEEVTLSLRCLSVTPVQREDASSHHEEVPPVEKSTISSPQKQPQLDLRKSKREKKVPVKYTDEASGKKAARGRGRGRGKGRGR